MKQSGKGITTAFLIFLLIDILFIVLQKEPLRWWSKPALMPVLLILFFTKAQQKKKAGFRLIVAALFLSWCGDLLLLADGLFIPGLVAFLLAHVAYICYFGFVAPWKNGALKKNRLFLAGVLIYVSVLLFVLFPYLAALKIPVVIYSLAIGLMWLMAINTRPAPAASYFIAGACFFVLSDSLLAIQLFAVKSRLFGPFVMATYGAAQLLLVTGALQNEKHFQR